MIRSFAQYCLLLLVTHSTHAWSLDPGFPGATGNEDGADVHVLRCPDDLRDFRSRALKVDGFFAPDIAFSVRTCPKCRQPYVFGTFPRLSRAPYDNLAAV